MKTTNTANEVNAYNHRLSENILLECDCYKTLKLSECFANGKNYMACIVLRLKEGSYHTFHLCLPIMLGSRVDINIRTEYHPTEFGGENDHQLYGCFVLDGQVSIIPNFTTNNLNEGHVYRNKKGEASINGDDISKITGKPPMNLFRLKVKCGTSHYLELDYDGYAGHSVIASSIKHTHKNSAKMNSIRNNFTRVKSQITREQTAKGESISNDIMMEHKKFKKMSQHYDKNYVQLKDTYGEDVAWINLMNETNKSKFKDFSTDEYLEFFEACTRHAPVLDSLSNKVLLSAGSMIKHSLDTFVENINVNEASNKKTYNEIWMELKRRLHLFATGNLYFVLSKKKNSYTISSDTKAPSVYQTVGCQKYSIASHIADCCRKNVQHTTRKSNALMFPIDGDHFICKTNLREMKGAGEVVYKTNLSKTTVPIYLSHIIRFLEKNNVNVLKQGDVSEKGQYILVLGAHLTRYVLTNDELMTLKQTLHEITLIAMGSKYIVLDNTGDILVKYSPLYKTYLSPYEAKFLWPDCFANMHHNISQSTLAMGLPESSIIAQPAKNVVSMSNIKGSCSILTNQLDMSAFTASNGIGNACIVHRDQTYDNDVIMSHDVVKPAKFEIDMTPAVTDEEFYLKSYLKVDNTIGVKRMLTSESSSSSSSKCPLPNIAEQTLERRVNAWQLKSSEAKSTLVPESRLLVDKSNEDESTRIRITQPDNNSHLNYLKLAEKGKCDKLPELPQKFFDEFNPKYDRSEVNGLSYGDILSDPQETLDDIAKIDNAKYKKMGRCLTLSNTRENIIPATSSLYDFIYRHKSCKMSQDEPAIQFADKTQLYLCNDEDGYQKYYDQYIKPDITSSIKPQMVLYTAYGDVKGYTNEDGIIVDEKIKTHGPTKIIHNNVTIKFEVSGKTKENVKINYKQGSDIVRDDNIIIGTLSSSHALKFRLKKNIIKSEKMLGADHRYLLYYKVSNHQHTKYCTSKLTETSTKGSGHISFKYWYYQGIMIGTKIANRHGQKGLISHVHDLSKINAYKRDGSIVHPQVLFSQISPVGRTTSSQIYELLNSPDVAITENGQIVAPMGINVHHLDPSNQMAYGTSRIDLMMTENGYVANELCTTLHYMSNHGSKVAPEKLTSFILELHKSKGYTVNMMASTPVDSLEEEEIVENAHTTQVALDHIEEGDEDEEDEEEEGEEEGGEEDEDDEILVDIEKNSDDEEDDED